MFAITFKPLYMERIWGGRQLETFYNRQLPSERTPFGEAWEIVDREDAQSIVESGPFEGKSLHELWSSHRSEIFGADLPENYRFPLLIKILDSAADLSIQVHPPAAIAETLDGEPKTEMWFIADAKPGSKLYVGLKKGVSRETFEKSIKDGTVADQVHSIIPKRGDSIFIESGRLHAIGAGFLIHEIQQNSDTTYRVFDWNRTDAEGNPRELHVEESLACIDFDDTEPEMDIPDRNTLATCPYFTTTLHSLAIGETINSTSPDRFCLITVVSGKLNNTHPTGQTLLLPKGADPLAATEPTEVLRITID
ncbi:type I phosphomannose isomerase catalytic subunit [Luteolibacter sp. AS25]|uniref:type I phosphomannose isomerase catalytic subunit n=1 Tax=Luteolibacter sp. AS25 TaxID=3135776 RepID=UPI00398B95AB